MFGGFWRGVWHSIWRGIFGPSERAPAVLELPPGMQAPPVSVAGSLQCAAVWACCRLLSQSIATLPGHIYQITDDGKRKATAHPLYRLLTVQPNPVMTLQQWLQTTVLHLALYGNAYTIIGEQDGEPFALWPWQPDRVRIIQDQKTGDYVYRVWDIAGRPKRDYLPNELLHFRIFSLDGIIGLSPIDFHRLTFELDAASRVYASSLYQNGGRPSGVFTTPGPLKKDQVDNIRATWRALHGGPANAGQVAILESGTKYEAVGIPPEQAQYIEQQKFSVEQIARIYGVPPHLVGAMDKPTYASVEQQALEFLQYTLQPIVTAIERSIQTLLLEEPYFYKLNIAAFERSDIKTRYAAYAVGRQWGWLSVNDVRELEDQNRIAEGDVYLTPLNMADAALSPTPTPGG
jgi:HK97 family phage portal protein